MVEKLRSFDIINNRFRSVSMIKSEKEYKTVNVSDLKDYSKQMKHIPLNSCACVDRDYLWVLSWDHNLPLHLVLYSFRGVFKILRNI